MWENVVLTFMEISTPSRSKQRWGEKNNHDYTLFHWLVVSTPLKNISQLGWWKSQNMEQKKVPNHRLDDLNAGTQSRPKKWSNQLELSSLLKPEALQGEHDPKGSHPLWHLRAFPVVLFFGGPERPGIDLGIFFLIIATISLSGWISVGYIPKTIWKILEHHHAITMLLLGRLTSFRLGHVQ